MSEPFRICEYCGDEGQLSNGKFCNDGCEIGNAYDEISELAQDNKTLQSRVAELEAAIQAWNDATDFDEHTKAVRVLQGLAKG